MSTAPPDWQVLPHGPLEQLGEHLWDVAGTVPRVPLGRRMTVARREDGGLVLHSPVALDDPTMEQLDALGPVATILIPSGHHRMDAARFAARYPEAQVLCPAGSRKRVEQATPVAGCYEDFAPDPRIALETLDGTKEREGVLSVVAADGVTLTFCDAVFNLPHQGGFSGLMVRLIGSSGRPKVTPTARTLIVADKAAFRAHLLRLADTPDLRRIIVAHHDRIEDEPGAVLRNVAEAL